MTDVRQGLAPELIAIHDIAPGDHEWAAHVMASSEPWITLGRTEASCRMVLHNPEATIFVAWVGRGARRVRPVPPPRGGRLALSRHDRR